MTDASQPNFPTSQTEIPPAVPESITPPPKKSHKKVWIIVGVVLGLLGVCAIIIFLCIAVIGIGAGKVLTEKAPVESVLDAYMKFMAAKDIENAYALFSPRARRQIPISQLQDMIEGNNYYVFEGYQSLSVVNIKLSTMVNADPDVPQGTVANVSGTITYAGSFNGTFTGTLEKVDGAWQIDGIYVAVPPNKFP